MNYSSPTPIAPQTQLKPAIQKKRAGKVNVSQSGDTKAKAKTKKESKVKVQKSSILKDVTVQPKGNAKLMKAVENANFLLQASHPEMAINANEIFKSLTAQPPVKQEAFIQAIEAQVKQKENQEKGWGERIMSTITSLKDKVINFQQEGQENYKIMEEVLGVVAGHILFEAKGTLEDMYSRAPNFREMANNSLSFLGNVSLSTATLALPFIAEWGTKAAQKIAGSDDPQVTEAAYEEAEALGKAIEEFLKATHIPDKPIDDLTALVEQRFQENVLNPIGVSLTAEEAWNMVFDGVIETTKYIPEQALAAALTILLPSLPGGANLSATESSVLISCFLTILSVGKLSVKESLMKFLFTNPASLRYLGELEFSKVIQEKVLGAINPTLTPILAYALYAISNKTIVLPLEAKLK